MRQAMGALVLALAAGCSGGPLKERPVFEPPPLLQETPPPPPEPAPDERPSTGVEPFSSDIAGAWRSAALVGPGSAAFQCVEFILRPDGTFAALAVAKERTVLRTGTYTVLDGVLLMDYGGESFREYSWVWEERTLVLGDGEARIVLTRIP